MWPIITSVLGVFLVILVGAGCRRCNWLTPESDLSLAKLTANVLLPAYLFAKIVGNESLDSLASTWAPPMFGFISTAIGFGLAHLFAKTIGPKLGIDSDSKQRAFALCAGICNYAYIPYSVAQRFYPDAMIDLILHNIGVDLALWSIGVAIVSQSVESNWRKYFLKSMLSAPLFAVVIAVGIQLSGLSDWCPNFLMTAVSTIGDCAIPVGLMLSGAIIVDYIGSFNWRGSTAVIVSAMGFRQLLMPMLMLSVTGLIANQTGIVTVGMKQVMMLQVAMPAAVFPIVLVRLHGRDTRTAIEVILGTSVAGLIAIPAWLIIAAWWLNL